MGLMAGFIAVAGLLGGLALLVMWAGVLERWVDGADVATDTLDSMLSTDELETAASESSEGDPGSAEADRFAYPPAA